MHKLLVVSDSHEASKKLLAMLASATKREGGVTRLIHLGDGARDGEQLAALLDVPLTAVQGNCDDATALPGEVTLVLDGVKLLMRHGHRLGVKATPLQLLLRAREAGARVALYGHTHLQHVDEQDGVLLLNPGALMNGHYALLLLDRGAASFELRTLGLSV